MSERVVLAAKIDVELRKRFDQFCLDQHLTLGEALERILTRAFFLPEGTEQVAEQVEAPTAQVEPTTRTEPGQTSGGLIKTILERVMLLEGRVNGLQNEQLAPTQPFATMDHLAPDQLVVFEKRLRALEAVDLDAMYAELKTGVLGTQECLRGTDEQVAQVKRRLDKAEAWIKAEQALILEDEALQAAKGLATRPNAKPEEPLPEEPLPEEPQPEVDPAPTGYYDTGPLESEPALEPALALAKLPKLRVLQSTARPDAPQPRHEPYDVNGRSSSHAAAGHMRVTWTHKSLKNRMLVKSPGSREAYSLIDNRDGTWTLKGQGREEAFHANLSAKEMAKKLSEQDMQPIWDAAE